MGQKSLGSVIFSYFWKMPFLCWPRLHLCVQKYSKTGILWNIIIVSFVGADRKKLRFEFLQLVHRWNEMTLSDFWHISYVNTHTHTHTHTQSLTWCGYDKGLKNKKVTLGTFSHFWRLRYQVSCPPGVKYWFSIGIDFKNVFLWCKAVSSVFSVQSHHSCWFSAQERNIFSINV